MLRLVDTGRTYDVVIKVGGADMKLVMKSLSFRERLQFMNDVSKTGGGVEGLDAANKLFDTVIVSIDGNAMKASDVLGALEHRQDREDIIQGALSWLTLPEQESKNSYSWLEQSTPPAPVRSAEPSAGDATDHV